MSKATNFEIGDIVEILPTATEQKYESSFPFPLGWDASMQRDIGQLGTIVHIFHSSGNVRVRVKVPSTGGTWVWKLEDLAMPRSSKWRRKTTCAS